MERSDTPGAWYWVHAYADRWTQPHVPTPGQDWFRMRVTTSDADGDPYDFWRHRVFYDFAADRRADPRLTFAASGEAVVSRRGEFVHARSSDMAGARTRAGISQLAGANLTIGFVLAGQRDYEIGDWRHRAAAGDLYLYDAAEASRLSFSDHRVAYLSLNAGAVSQALGPERPDHATLLARLGAAPLLPFLRKQLGLLIESPRRPEPVDAGTMLDIAVDLALLMLQQTPDLPEVDLRDTRRGLVAAAQQVIAARLDHPGLDSAMIAGLLGCSRATLYRAFALFGLTVAGHIRTMRMIRARHLIEHSAYSDRIGDLILACGIEDAVHFARQFRNVFGIRPSEIKGIRLGDKPAW